MKRLNELIGEEVLVQLDFSTKPEKVKLVALDYGGIWVESSALTQGLLEKLNLQAGKTPLVFLPLAQIRYIFQASDEIALSERSFGVSTP